MRPPQRITQPGFDQARKTTHLNVAKSQQRLTISATMANRVSSMVFRDGNHGIQVGQSNAPIQASFNLPPGTLELG